MTYRERMIEAAKEPLMDWAAEIVTDRHAPSTVSDVAERIIDQLPVNPELSALRATIRGYRKARREDTALHADDESPSGPSGPCDILI